jgi:hypothetical protein
MAEPSLRTPPSSRWQYPQVDLLSIYPNHLGCDREFSGDTSGDTLFRNPVQRFAAACKS